MDPAIAYGIVFTNFMRKGIYTFKDGTDSLIRKMVDELRSNGAELRRQCLVERLITEERDGKSCVTGVIVNGKKVNSQKLKLPSGKILKDKNRKLFETNKIKLNVLKSEKIIGLN